MACWKRAVIPFGKVGDTGPVRELYFEAGVNSSAPPSITKADGSREHSEPWSEGGGNRQLCWLFISTKPKRKK